MEIVLNVTEIQANVITCLVDGIDPGDMGPMIEVPVWLFEKLDKAVHGIAPRALLQYRQTGGSKGSG